MTLGTGIFLSATLLGLILLFNATKDRWNWKRIMKWVWAVVVGIPLLGAGIFWAEDEGVFKKSFWEKPSRQTSMWGIELGMDKEDVLFLKGKPEAEKEQKDDDGKEDGSVLSYPSYWVFLDNNDKVETIAFGGDSYGHSGIYGVKVGTSVEALVEKFGEPDFIKKPKNEDEYWRRYEYYDLNVLFVLNEGQVKNYGVQDLLAKASDAAEEAN